MPGAARAHPIWFSPVVELPHNERTPVWREKLDLRLLKDMIDEETHTVDCHTRVQSYIREHLRVEGGLVLLGRGQFTTMGLLTEDWLDFTRAVPPVLFARACGRAPEKVKYSGASKRMMHLMGWAPGKGLADGRTEPVSVPGQSSKRGLGAQPSRADRKTQKKEREEKIVAARLGDAIVYGKPSNSSNAWSPPRSRYRKSATAC